MDSQNFESELANKDKEVSGLINLKAGEKTLQLRWERCQMFFPYTRGGCIDKQAC